MFGVLFTSLFCRLDGAGQCFNPAQTFKSKKLWILSFKLTEVYSWPKLFLLKLLLLP